MQTPDAGFLGVPWVEVPGILRPPLACYGAAHTFGVSIQETGTSARLLDGTLAARGWAAGAMRPKGLVGGGGFEPP